MMNYACLSGNIEVVKYLMSLNEFDIKENDIQNFGFFLKFLLTKNNLVLSSNWSWYFEVFLFIQQIYIWLANLEILNLLNI